MIIRQTQMTDLERVMCLYDSGRQYMRRNGNHLQWINGYPRREKIEEDIQLGHSYVVTEDEEIECVFCFFHGTAPEPSYDRINGAWLNDEPYGVIHRIVSSGKISGMVARCADWCLQKCANLRIDTHADNRPMQQALERAGFRYCGVVVIDDGTERVAYQKTAKR